ncbi:hypothetical protein [Salinispora arenicola]|uniref:hypothetical protein n=1 Tax=Salinispora arenicola TaxID=168697 RepID=UPI0016A3BE2A|nr:hypothetical protein [Salinispora arenicola]NIL64939.1 hypothetical protein [Salinispora arenicola]
MEVLILRRREEGRPATATREWETTRRVTLGEAEVRVNAYFLDRPGRVLGRLGTAASTAGTNWPSSVTGTTPRPCACFAGGRGGGASPGADLQPRPAGHPVAADRRSVPQRSSNPMATWRCARTACSPG